MAFESIAPTSIVASSNLAAPDTLLDTLIANGVTHAWVPGVSTETVDSGVVTGLSDAIGARHLTDPGSGNRPTWVASQAVLDGRPSIVYQDDPATRLNIPLDIHQNINSFTWLSVARPTTLVTNNRLVTITTNAAASVARFAVQITNAGALQYIGKQQDSETSSNTRTVADQFVINTNYIITCQHNYAAGTRYARVNGSQVDSTSVGAWTGASDDTTSTLARHGANAAGNGQIGDIAATCIWRGTAPTLTQVQNVEAAVADYYGGWASFG